MTSIGRRVILIAAVSGLAGGTAGRVEASLVFHHFVATVEVTVNGNAVFPTGRPPVIFQSVATGSISYDTDTLRTDGTYSGSASASIYLPPQFEPFVTYSLPDIILILGNPVIIRERDTSNSIDFSAEPRDTSTGHDGFEVGIQGLSGSSFTSSSISLHQLGGFYATGVVTRLDDMSIVPEPSTLLPACTGALAGLGYAWRRRKRAAA